MFGLTRRVPYFCGVAQLARKSFGTTKYDLVTRNEFLNENVRLENSMTYLRTEVIDLVDKSVPFTDFLKDKAQLEDSIKNLRKDLSFTQERLDIIEKRTNIISHLAGFSFGSIIIRLLIDMGLI